MQGNDSYICLAEVEQTKKQDSRKGDSGSVQICEFAFWRCLSRARKEITLESISVRRKRTETSVLRTLAASFFKCEKLVKRMPLFSAFSRPKQRAKFELVFAQHKNLLRKLISGQSSAKCADSAGFDALIICRCELLTE